MKTWLRLLLVALTVGGGFAGMTLSLQVLHGLKNPEASRVIVALIFVGMYAFVTASGLLFVYDPKRTRLVLASLAVQIPWVSCPVFVYQFSSGLHAAITLGTPEDTSRVGLHLGWNLLYFGAHFLFRAWAYQDIPWTFGVNAVPVVLIVLLLRSTRSHDPKPRPQIADDSKSVAV